MPRLWQGGSPEDVAGGTIHRRYVATGRLTYVRGARGSYFERFAAWLDDPDLPEDYTAAGEITASVPAYAMTSLRPEVTLHYDKPTLPGGSLRMRTGVCWSRMHADHAQLVGGILPSGSRRLVVTGTATVQASPTRFRCRTTCSGLSGCRSPCTPPRRGAGPRRRRRGEP